MEGTVECVSVQKSTYIASGKTPIRLRRNLILKDQGTGWKLSCCVKFQSRAEKKGLKEAFVQSKLLFKYDEMRMLLLRLSENMWLDGK